MRGDGCIFSGTGKVTVNNYGVPYEAYGELAGKYVVTEEWCEALAALRAKIRLVSAPVLVHGDTKKTQQQDTGPPLHLHV